MASISVITVNYNGRECLADLFDSLARQTRRPDEVIMVDNASADGSAGYVQREYPWVTVIPLDVNVGFAEGNNAGVRQASGNYLALINSDARVHEKWLEELEKVLNEFSDVAAVVPKIYRDDDRSVLEAAGAAFDNLGYSWSRGHKSPDGVEFSDASEVPGVTACSMIVKRSALDGDQLFDPSFFMYYEEFDLTLRLRGRGHRIVYAPAAIAYHQGMHSVRKAVRDPELFQRSLCNRNRLKIFFKYYPLGLILRGLPLTILGGLYWNWFFLQRGGPVFAIRAMLSQFRYAVAGLSERRRTRTLNALQWRAWMSHHRLADLLAARTALQNSASPQSTLFAMRDILRVKAIYSVTPLVTIAAGLVAAKAWALLLGPGGLGIMALMQSFVSLTALIAGAGVATAFVRAAAEARANDDKARLDGLRRGGALITMDLAIAAVVVIVVLSPLISHAIFSGLVSSRQIALLASAVFFSTGLSFANALLNAEQRVGALTLAGVLNVVLATGAVLLTVMLWRTDGIAPGLAAGAFLSFAAAAWLARRNGASPGPAGRAERWVAARSVLRFGVPYMMAALASPMVQLLLPILILRRLGTHGVGYYRSAAVVPVYLGMFLTAAALDYYPRISAAPDNQVLSLARDERRIVWMLAILPILAILVFAPLLLPLVYSSDFRPAVPLLQWMMAGEILRFWSWSFAYALLARCGSVTYFIAEASGAVAYVGLSLVAVRSQGLIGIGIAYAAAQAIYTIVVALLARRELRAASNALSVA